MTTNSEIEAIFGGQVPAALGSPQPMSTAIYRKMNLVMAQVQGVAKRGRNDFHHYDYATEADILEAVRTSFIEQQLVLLPQLLDIETINLEGGKSANPITQIVVQFRIVDAETGAFVEAVVPAQGQDAGDKGVYKALTGAMKYFLLKTFMIPTGDDPEKEEAPKNTSGSGGGVGVRRNNGPASAQARVVVVD